MLQPATFLQIIQPRSEFSPEFFTGGNQGNDTALGVGGRCRLRNGQPSLGDELAPGVEDAGPTLQNSAATLRAIEHLRELEEFETQQTAGQGLPADAKETQLLPQALRQQ